MQTYYLHKCILLSTIHIRHQMLVVAILSYCSVNIQGRPRIPLHRSILPRLPRSPSQGQPNLL